MLDITNTYNAALTTIMQKVPGEITLAQAKEHIKRAKRISQCARYGVSASELQDGNLKSTCRKLGIEL